jgi:hypothetical protein
MKPKAETNPVGPPTISVSARSRMDEARDPEALRRTLAHLTCLAANDRSLERQVLDILAPQSRAGAEVWELVVAAVSSGRLSKRAALAKRTIAKRERAFRAASRVARRAGDINGPEFERLLDAWAHLYTARLSVMPDTQYLTRGRCLGLIESKRLRPFESLSRSAILTDLVLVPLFELIEGKTKLPTRAVARHVYQLVVAYYPRALTGPLNAEAIRRRTDTAIVRATIRGSARS